MENNLTEQQSLEVIAEMIRRTQNNVRKGAGTYMIFWGYLVAFTAICNVLLIFALTEAHQSYLVWWLMLPGTIVFYFRKRKKDQISTVKTHFDSIIWTTWSGFSISIALLLFIIFSLSHSFETEYYFYLINPLILMMMGLAEYITAKVSRFKPILFGAIIMWAGSVACLFSIFLFSSFPIVAQFTVLATCMILGFVVPGNRLNKLAKNV